MKEALIHFHNNCNTWKYTLDVYRLRICWWRKKKVNSLNMKVPVIAISWG